MKKVIFTSAILLASLAAGAQGLANVWNGFYNQVSPVITTDVQCSWVDAAGNLYTAGMQQSDVDADIATANVTTLGNSGSNYFYFCKYNSSGVLQLAKQLNSSSVNTTDMAGGIVSDASGNIYVTGHFTGTVDFDPGAGTSAKTSTSGGSGFLAKYSSTGALLWVQNFGNIYTYPQDIALNPVNGNVWIGGYLIANSSIGYADMDPGAGTASNFGNSNGSVGFYCAYSAAAGSYIANTNYAICSTTLNYDCSVNAICFDGTTSNIYLTGSFRGTIYPDNSTSGGPPITTSATKAMFTIRQDIVNTNVNASYDYFDGSPVNEGTDIAVDASGNIFTAGY
ncbi:MAG TPA: hypothetical protein VFU15_10810, partial [Bacteroidia bacterium]|nr:hypothetical protein [Bacteroidia bacterium]